MANWLKRYDVIAVVLLFLLAIPAGRYEWFAAVEDQTLSLRHLVRGGHAFPDNILFVNTDEAFFEEYKSWPLRRSDIARIVANLRQLGAKVVGVDLLFDFPSSYGEDPGAAAMFRSAGNVVVVSQGVIEDEKLQDIRYPIPPILAVAGTGYSNIQSASGVIESMSRIRVYPNERGLRDGWPFSVQVLSKYLDAEPRLEGDRLMIGDLAVNLDRNNDLHIDFPLFPAGAGSYGEHHGMSALDVLDLRGKDPEELAELRALVEGRIVLLGDTSEVSHDYFETPIGTVYGVEIIGATIDTLQNGGPLRPAPIWLEVLIAALLAAGLLYTATIQSPGKRIATAAVEFFVWLAIAVALYAFAGSIVWMSYMMIAGTLGFLIINLRYYLQERDQKALIRDAFGQYLSPKVVNILVKDPTRLSLGGERKEMTAFFSDLAGFSTISEMLSPDDLVALLNEYLTSMCDIIAEYDGTVDKFEGDAIIAFWGAPLEQLNHAELGCLATIDMQRFMMGYRKQLQQRGHPPLNMRVGVNTGAMLVGNLGSRQRMDYTIIGDSVNLAARLEGANKQFGTRSMISQHTYAHVREIVEARELDRIRVVGKREAVTVYELVERKGYLTDQQKALFGLYEQGLVLYRGGEFRPALEVFQRALEIDERDGPSSTYLRRCEQYLITPPASNWDGVFELDSK